MLHVYLVLQVRTSMVVLGRRSLWTGVMDWN